ncbi:uncharacterized protein LOC141880875 [Acropora palmata]|uniref:uncharacterized protein LOC141880875 n=1 Tax=Acropora palmata TaxID=6131 RepID=UPI003DA11E8A
MENRLRNILRRHRLKIRMDLEPENILAKLVEILSDTDEGEIKAETTREKKCDKLLEILPRKGPNAFKVFVEALKGEASHLASDLIEVEEGTEHEPTHVGRSSAKLREEIHELKTKLRAVEQSYKKTQQKHEVGKTRDGKGKDIDIIAVGLQKKETTSESLSEKEQDEREQKEIERDSARGESHSLRKEVKEMKNIIPEKSGDYQPKIQALQRDEGRRERKERGNLQLLSRKPEAAKEEKQLQRKATRPERKFSQQISKVTCEKGKKKKKKKKRTTTQKVRCCRKEFVAADTEAKIDFLPQVADKLITD